jgi:hypothetical protein
VRPNLSIIRENLLPHEAVEPVIDILTNPKLDVWIYNDKDWFVPSRHGPHVDREEWTVKFPPKGETGLIDKEMLPRHLTNLRGPSTTLPDLSP